MAQDLDLALRIKSDMKAARRDIAALRGDVARLGTSGRGAATGLRNLGAQTGQLGRRMQGLSRLALAATGALSGLAAAFSLRTIIRATVAQEDAVRQLEQALVSTGNAVGLSSRQLQDHAADLQRVTTVGDETILELQAQLLAFTGITGDAFRRTTEVLLDFAARTGRSASSAVRTFGVALNSPAEGMSRLRQAGIDIAESQQELIKRLAESGRTAEAQALLLDELERSYGGAARAARDTFGGALQGLKNAFGDLLEANQGLPAAREEIEKLTTALSDPKVQADMDRFVSGLVTGFADLAGDLPGVVTHLEKVAKLMTTIAAALAGASIGRAFGPTGALVGAGVGGLGAAGALFAGDVGRALPGGQLIEDALARGRAQEDQLRALGDSLRGAAAGVAPIRIAEPGAGGARPAAAPQDTAAADAAQAAAEKRADAIAKIVAALREQAATEGQTAEQVALYRLAQLGADEATLARAQRLIQSIQLTRDEAAAMDASREAAERQVEAIHEARLADQALLVELADEIRLLGLSARERAQDEAARRLSAEATDEQREAVRALAGGLYDLTEAARENADQMSAFAEQAARNMQDAFAEFLFDPFQGGLDGMLRGLVDTLRRMASEAIAARIFDALGAEEKLAGILGAGDDAAGAAAQQAAAAAAAATLATGGATTGTALAAGATTGAGALTAAGAATAASIVAGAQAAAAMLTAAGAAGGGGAGGLTSILSGLFHGGGIVGQATAHRSLPALAWAGAPRYHSGGIAGLAADEMPAILRRREEVLTESDPRHRFNLARGGGEPPVVNIKNVNAFDGQTVRDEMSSSAGERVILNVVSRNKRLLGIP